MFFICNGILAFLSKSSVLSLDDQSELIDGKIPSPTGISKMMKDSVGNSEEDGTPFVAEQGEEEEEQEDQGSEYLYRDNYDEVKSEAMREEDEDNVEDGSGLSPVNQEEEEIEGTTTANEELASTEEQNKKFEEFIRKMKEEIRIEAQQQLIKSSLTVH